MGFRTVTQFRVSNSIQTAAVPSPIAFLTVPRSGFSAISMARSSRASRSRASLDRKRSPRVARIRRSDVDLQVRGNIGYAADSAGLSDGLGVGLPGDDSDLLEGLINRKPRSRQILRDIGHRAITRGRYDPSLSFFLCCLSRYCLSRRGLSLSFLF